MPTYEYECDKCGHQFERFQRITEEPLKRCPKCKSKVRRLVGSGVGILFKGSGFYQTDYRSASYKQGQKSESATATPAAPAKSGATPEAKSGVASPAKGKD